VKLITRIAAIVARYLMKHIGDLYKPEVVKFHTYW